MTLATVNLEICNKGDCSAEAWILTGPGKPPDLFLVTEDASVAAYLIIYFLGFILPFTIAVHILCSLLMMVKKPYFNSLCMPLSIEFVCSEGSLVKRRGYIISDRITKNR